MDASQRIPFDFYSFWDAMDKKIGYCARRIIWQGQEGYCEFVCTPHNVAHRAVIEQSVPDIRRLLEPYEITSQSVHFLREDAEFGTHLRIIIRHPPRSTKKAELSV